MNQFDFFWVLETTLNRVSWQDIKGHSPWKLNGARHKAGHQNFERNAKVSIDVIAAIGMLSALEDLLDRQAEVCLNTYRVIY